VAALTIPTVFASAGAFGEEEKIYQLMPNTSLSGVVNPYMPDRADIKKAWPHPPADPKNIQVGWTEITMGNPWFVELGKAAQRGAKEHGFTVDMQIADSDLQRQCAQIDTFITQKERHHRRRSDEHAWRQQLRQQGGGRGHSRGYCRDCA
jgi:ribose transport system substrate-binding protein